jgi:putative ABC transport system permease protein
MKFSALGTLVTRDLVRSRGALTSSGFGIMAGTASLVFFLALGLGVRAVVLGQVFPIERIELEPQAGPEPGLLTVLLGGAKSPSIDPATVELLRTVKGTKQVYPKLRFAFPSGAFGGKEILGKDFGTHEMLADGIEPSLVSSEIKGKHLFVDPLEKPGPACDKDEDCKQGLYCELPSQASHGQCSEPVPVLVSNYLVEVFNKGIAPAHNLPGIGRSLLTQAQGITFRFHLGTSMMGNAKQGKPRWVKARVVGISSQAIDLGATLPLGVVRRWNKEFGGQKAAESYSSVVIWTNSASDVAHVIDEGERRGLRPKDTTARDVSVLINGIIALLMLVAGVMFAVASSNIAYTFRVLVSERTSEIGLYRAIGATPGDIRKWLLCLAAVVGTFGGMVGVILARSAAWMIDLYGMSKIPEFPFKPSSFFLFPPWLLSFGVGFGALCAILGALTSMRKAASVDPARALIDSLVEKNNKIRSKEGTTNDVLLPWYPC